jgi:hypothetical protein
MCEIAGGEVLVAYPSGDDALRSAVQDVIGIASRYGIENPRSLRDIHHELSDGAHYKLLHDVVRLSTGLGREHESATRLHRLFARVGYDRVGPGGTLGDDLDDERIPFYAAPNALWSAAAPLPGGSGRHQFNLLEAHERALNTIEASVSPARCDGIRIGVVDSGLDPGNLSRPPVRQINVVDYYDDANPRQDVSDGTGHGSLVSRLIQTVAPDAEFEIIRVFTSSGCSTDWHIMLGLALAGDCDVTNISIESQLGGTHARCGSLGHAAVTSLFESVLRDSMLDPHRILVAAAGNAGDKALAFPARFADVVAVMSVNHKNELSRFTNRGDRDEHGLPHSNVFVAPGGEHDDEAGLPDEALARLRDDPLRTYWGTSFAAAYATGVVAMHIAQARSEKRLTTRSEILGRLHETANRDPRWYDAALHGDGMVQAPADVETLMW